MNKVLVLILILATNPIKLSAQGENNIWAFGNGSGLDFNSGSPVFTPTNMYSREGCAAISDAFGNLLFYTSGNMVWDRNGDPMPNGNILGNAYDGSGTQAVLILKSISNSDEYYIFTLDPQEVAIGQSPKLRYSVVDMTLNNGLGDIELAQKDIELDDEMEERMYAVEADDCGYWIVGHKRRDNQYVTFKLTASGLSGPIYSPGTFASFFYGSDAGGEIKISHDRRKIAISFNGGNPYQPGGENGSQYRIEIGEFDPGTGLVSNTAILDSNDTFLYQGGGLSFSPDDSKLYATSQDYSALFQYDLSYYPNIAAIKSSKTKVFETGYLNLFYMRNGPDKKIYLANFSDGYISCIQNPDALGVACNFDSQNIAVPASGHFYPPDPFYGFGFGNPTVTITYKDTLPGSYTDTLICFSDSALLAVPDNLLGYVWNDGLRGASRYVHEEGLYYCLSTQNCTMRMDTFKVTFEGNLELGPDTTLCPGDSLMLQVSGNGFEWQDGSRDSVYTVKDPGAYSVTLNQQGCYYTDTIHVDIYDPKAIILETDTLICTGDKLILHGASQPSGSYLWSTGAETPDIETGESGTYRLQADNICGSFYDSITVTVQDCNCRPGLPNAFSPNGDGLNDFFKPVLNCFTQGFNLAVYNRYGQRLFSSFRQENGWDGTFRNRPLEIGTYFYTMQYETPNGERVQRKGDFILIR